MMIITAGGVINGGIDSDVNSVELYDSIDKKWHSGPSLPYGLSASAMAEFPDGRGVLLFGGHSNENDFPPHHFDNRILELRAGANSWNILDVFLENAGACHAV